MALSINPRAAALPGYRAPALPPVAPHDRARPAAGGTPGSASSPVADLASFTGRSVPDGGPGRVPGGVRAGDSTPEDGDASSAGAGAAGTAVGSAPDRSSPNRFLATATVAIPIPVAVEPKGVISVGGKSLDLTSIEYLPTDGPAVRAGKLRAAIAAVFDSAVAGAVGPARDILATGVEASNTPRSAIETAARAAELVGAAAAKIRAQAGPALLAHATSVAKVAPLLQ